MVSRTIHSLLLLLRTTVLALTMTCPQFTRQQLVAELQRCVTPTDVLDRVGRHVSITVDPDASLSALILVRLSKQMVSIDNDNGRKINRDDFLLADDALSIVVSCLASSNGSNIDSLVDGTKACSILSRLLSSSFGDDKSQIHSRNFLELLPPMWEEHAPRLVDKMQEQHLSGLLWAFDGLQVATQDCKFSLPKVLQDAYDELHLPFRILPGCLGNSSIPNLSVLHLTSEVDFRVDEIRTTASKKIVEERRQTAWQGDPNVGPFCYSGKSMPRSDWSSTVEAIRDILQQEMGEYYNGCLLNLYPDGGSGMRYHIDPEQGTVWDYDTAIVSVGASRRFAFRRNVVVAADGKKPQKSKPHNFVVMHGDVTHMFGDCQERFQHSVKNADNKKETAPRISLVFKRTWDFYNSQ